DAGGGPTQHAVAAAFQSRWVAGGALSRRLDHDGWVDTVYLGAWPRSTFDRYGGFDESLVRNQEDEHNLRIVKGGGRGWQPARPRHVVPACFVAGLLAAALLAAFGGPGWPLATLAGLYVAAVAAMTL